MKVRVLLEYENEERSFRDLSLQEQVKVMDITSPEQMDIRLLNTWEDDHVLCAGVEVNGIKMAFLWIGQQGVGAVEYADDSPRARAYTFQILQDQITNGLYEMVEYGPTTTRVQVLLKQPNSPRIVLLMVKHFPQAGKWLLDILAKEKLLTPELKRVQQALITSMKQ